MVLGQPSGVKTFFPCPCEIRRSDSFIKLVVRFTTGWCPVFDFEKIFISVFIDTSLCSGLIRYKRYRNLHTRNHPHSSREIITYFTLHFVKMQEEHFVFEMGHPFTECAETLENRMDYGRHSAST